MATILSAFEMIRNDSWIITEMIGNLQRSSGIELIFLNRPLKPFPMNPQIQNGSLTSENDFIFQDSPTNSFIIFSVFKSCSDHNFSLNLIFLK